MAMISTAIAVFVVGGLAFQWIARTLASLTDAPLLAKRPASKFVMALLLFWGIEGLVIGTVIVLRTAVAYWGGAAGHPSAITVGLTFWTGGLILSVLAALLVPGANRPLSEIDH